jgi:peptidoglycan hydrolase-like protein with peptidoglycan-binding domain
VAVSSRRPLQGAVSSPQVTLAQRTLKGLGYDPGPIDGIYGVQTARAVRDFQDHEGLNRDGIIGVNTWRSLVTHPTDGRRGQPGELQRPLHGATSGDDVEQAQRALQALGLEPGPIDRVYGPRTEHAVVTFQERAGLVADGIVGADTWAALIEPSTSSAASSHSDAETASDAAPELILLVAENSTDQSALNVQLDHLVSAGRIRGWRPLLIGPTQDGAAVTSQIASALVVLVGLTNELIANTGYGPNLVEAVLPKDWPLSRVATVLIESTKSDLYAMYPTLSDDGRPLVEFTDPTSWDALTDRIVALVDAAHEQGRPWFPGFTSDRMVGKDALGRQAQVDFLCSVLAANSLETPLAVGLFGDWGSGKSFFMDLMQKRITALSESSAAEAKAGKPTFYCTHVVQVVFNAWLHADSAMWPSLAAKVFRSVSGIDTDVPTGPTQAFELSRFQEDAESHYRAQIDSQRSSGTEEAVLQRRIEELDQEIAERDASRLERLATLGRPATALAGAAMVGSTARARWRRLRVAWADMSGWDRAGLVAVPLLAICIAVLAALRPDWIAVWIALVLPFGAVLAVAGRALRFVDETAAVRELHVRRRALQSQRDASAQQQADQARQVRSFDALPLLPHYVEQQAGRWSEQEDRGELTEIRLAFERLSALITRRRATATTTATTTNQATGERVSLEEPPLDRIVVYIDDLDRCPPSKVVSVLGAINLLLDLPHFVVVVGVDSRWLFRSLELQFSQLLGTEGDAGALPADESSAASPQQYLEKIFQYSVVLPRVTSAGFTRLVDGLLPVHVPTPAPSHAQPATPQPSAHPLHTEPTAAPTASEPPVEQRHEDLTPRDLLITAAEIACVRSLAPWFETPRAVKRLTNLYRLVRVFVGEERLLADESYRRILFLLAVAISFPSLAPHLFRAIQKSEDDGPRKTTLRQILDDDAKRSPAATVLVVRLLDEPPWALLATEPLTSLRDWVPVVAGFSFYPWREGTSQVTDPK